MWPAFFLQISDTEDKIKKKLRPKKKESVEFQFHFKL